MSARNLGPKVESIADKGYLEPHETTLPPNIIDGSFEKEFKTRVRSAGLSHLEVEVVNLRFIYDYKLKEICEELHIPNSQTALNLLNRALGKLKKKGFGVRK